MSLLQSFYRIIYNPKINYSIRNLNYFINRFINTGLKIPPSGRLKIKTDSGALNLTTNQSSYLTQLLFWKGYKTFEYSSLFEELVKEVDVFFDIGANIGYYSLLAHRANPKLKAFTFEPATGPLFYLKQNVILNRSENNIQVIDKALSKTIGSIDFYEVENVKYKYLDYNLAGEGNAGTKTTSRNFKKNTVDSITLSSFIETNNIKKIDLVKIDTEGTEIDILLSGKKYIEQFQPIVICETLFNTIEDDLENFFKPLGYKFFNHTLSGLREVNSIKRSQDDGIRNCFFVPDSKKHLIEKFTVNS